MLTPGDVVELDLGQDDHNRLSAPSAAQCQQVRAVATGRIAAHTGNVGPVFLQQIRNVLSVILDL